MHALETLPAWRVVADPSSIETLLANTGATVLRFALDDALVLATTQPSVTDQHAIVVPDHGWSGTWLTRANFDTAVRPFIDWELPVDGIAQGLVAGVPAKVLIGTDLVLVACLTAYAHELTERLEKL